jgi:predicted DNA-binding WGR domain protein
MLNQLCIALEAHNDDTNRHRAYTVMVGQDLWGDWSVTVNYGRTGCRGKLFTQVASSLTEAQELVQRLLKKRLSAPKRIGCGYMVVAASAAAGFEMETWLPALWHVQPGHQPQEPWAWVASNVASTPSSNKANRVP